MELREMAGMPTAVLPPGFCAGIVFELPVETFTAGMMCDVLPFGLATSTVDGAGCPGWPGGFTGAGCTPDRAGAGAITVLLPCAGLAPDATWSLPLAAAFVAGLDCADLFSTGGGSGLLSSS